MSACDRATRRAARSLRAGGIVAYPTESCFGLGCDPGSRRAVTRLLRLKRRPQRKGLILVAASAGLASRYADLLPQALASWPGAYTWLLPPSARVRPWVRGRHERVAIRVPDHTIARALSHACGLAVVSTSANRSGTAPVRSARELRRRFGGAVDVVVPGRIGGRRTPSTIIDGATGRVLRGGA